MTEHWYLMLTRAVAGGCALFIGVVLVIAFVKNHYTHKPKRWLVGWQGLAFLAVGLDQLWRVWTRSNFIFFDVAQDVTSWQYMATAAMLAVGLLGVLFVWLRWPDSRTTGNHDKRYSDIKPGGTD